jgi:hypothetical protein
MGAGMDRNEIVLLLAILLMIMNINCGGAQAKTSDTGTAEHNIIKPPMEFVGPDDRKLWEGEIEGSSVASFRSSKESRVKNVIVVTRDNLPKFFKRIEYIDNDGDGSLDLMKMKIYEEGKGWRDVGITKDNKYGLKYANSKYNELLRKIKEAQAR